MDRKEREESRRICEAATMTYPCTADDVVGGDYTFYCHARTALPAALDEIDRLESELAVRDRALEKMERITAALPAALDEIDRLADLIEEWRDANGLPGCREGVFADNITHPAGAPVDPAAARAKMAEEGE